jgi:hypothetical protein
MKKLSVYTANFNGYDDLRPPDYPDGADYICFTDTPGSAPRPWQERVVQSPHPDPRKAARYYLLQSCLALPEYEYTIMHGANAVLSAPPDTLLQYVRKTPVAAFMHPHRSSVYSETAACAVMGKDTLKNMEGQMMRYQAEGFDGTPFSACILLVRRNCPELQEMESLWWAEVAQGSHRDQLAFDYARWKLSLLITYIPGDPFSSPFLSLHQHIY